ADALYREAAPEAAPDAVPATPPEVPSGSAPGTEAVEVAPRVEAPPTVPAPRDDACALLDARSDFIIELQLLEPAPAAILDGLWQRKFDFDKPVHVCGLTLHGEVWERAIADSQTLYTRLRVALQLVDRGGAISATRLSDFRDLVVNLAKQIKADVTLPDVNETHQRGLEMDAFCAEVDQMVGLNLVPPGERQIPGGKLAQAAALLGMTLEADGAFHLLNEPGHSLYSLCNLDSQPFQPHTLETSASGGITLLLDVPRVAQPALQFDQMVLAARQLAIELQLNIVDDHRVVLSEAGLSRIREQIAAVEAKMCEHGTVPGSAQARRLFS
ncbi:MAG: cell division protein ZipA C-terminal FtsZ-binding domain-containing protein, partial [Nitrosomonadales bacterium]|nr:cell division protein ZipA C-terminal FtsZ-binding domain-containing protein [Nitrosomonadales bacterium]